MEVKEGWLLFAMMWCHTYATALQPGVNLIRLNVYPATHMRKRADQIFVDFLSDCREDNDDNWYDFISKAVLIDWKIKFCDG